MVIMALILILMTTVLGVMLILVILFSGSDIIPRRNLHSLLKLTNDSNKSQK